MPFENTPGSVKDAMLDVNNYGCLETDVPKDPVGFLMV